MRFARRLCIILGAALALRVAYVIAQPRFDAAFAHPILDGAYYLAWAKAWPGGPGARLYYMPPLYPAFLASVVHLFGEAWSLLYVLQHAMVVAAAGLLGLVARRAAGDAAGLAAAVLGLLYGPALFFASRPLGEPLALLLICAALWLAGDEGAATGFGAGVGTALAALARPNVLPVPAAWAICEAWNRRFVRASAIVLGTMLTILPAACHNRAVSGRWIPISANGGVVFWLGNAPGAVGVYTPVEGFSGALDRQQDEAIREASRRAGRPLTAAEADRFFWHEGLQARAADPAGTIGLVGRRVMLTLDGAEHGLDYAPALDGNPWRWAAPLPFAALLGLAVFGVAASGFAKTGGPAVWTTVAVAALAPLVFYVSSRHRLPFAFLLAVPAGVGLASVRSVRSFGPAVAGLLACTLSLAAPTGDLVRTERAGAFASLADLQRKAGDLRAAEASARRAVTLDPKNAVAWFNLGVIEAAAGRSADAERDYRSALSVEPAQPDAAANLAGLLVGSGRAREAVAMLEPVVAAHPGHDAAWTNLVVAQLANGDAERARATAARAEAAGIALDPELLRAAGARP